jgi:hypothetical protein
MPVLVLLAVVIVASLFRLRRHANGTDMAARIVAAATNRLPVGRREWGRAMLAELSQIDRPARRWRFAAGVVRVALLPPATNPARVLGTATLGALVAAAATAATARTVPSLTAFIAVLGVALGGYATVMIARTPPPQRSHTRLVVAAVTLAALGAAVAVVVRIAAAHPSATTDHSHHLFSVLFAVTLTGYVAVAMRTPGRGGQPTAAPLWGLGGGLAIGVASIAIATTTTGTASGITALVSPFGVAATFAAATGAAATAGDRAAGIRAGMLTAILGALIRFTVDLTTLLQAHHPILTNSYDIGAFPHSGYPDIASYLLSDAIAGGILGGLLLYPLLLSAVALIGAAAGARLHRPACRRTVHPLP